jgi:di/tricarboxylate transporter
MPNKAFAAFITPIAIAVAHTFSTQVLPFLKTVMIPVSAIFMTPIGYQTNTMIYSAENNTFKNFLK